MKKLLLLSILTLFASCTQTNFTGRSNMNSTMEQKADNCENLYSDMEILNNADLDTPYNFFKNHRGDHFARIYTAPQGDGTDSVIISLENINDISNMADELEDVHIGPAYFVSCKFNVNYTKYNVRDMCEPSTGGNLIVGPEVLRNSNFDLNQKVVVADNSTEKEFISIFPTYMPKAQAGMKKGDIILLISGKNGTVIAIGDNPYSKCRPY